MYCLDSNIVIAVFRGDSELKDKISKLIGKDVEFCITPITLCELYKGAFLAKSTAEAVALIDRFLKTAKLLDFTEPACLEFGKSYAELKSRGKLTQQADLMIASIVKADDLILITRNKKDFEHIPGLKLEVW
jgi:tRNA(fMet)-specific endonuclease VapC